MGRLIYGGVATYEFDDRTLAHVKIAITQKLRLQEGFLLSWVEPLETGSGRVSLWLSPSMPLEFRYSAEKAPALNRNWLEALARSSHGTRGMVVMSEEEAEAIITASSFAEEQDRLRAAVEKIAEPATPRQAKRL